MSPRLDRKIRTAVRSCEAVVGVVGSGSCGGPLCGVNVSGGGILVFCD
jgi:hypothetical protein